MTTAEADVRREVELSAPQAVVSPWWQRGHTWYLAFLALLNVVFDAFAFHPDVGEGMTYAWAGVLLAQLFLLGFWLAFGGLHIVARYLMVAGAVACGVTSVSLSMSSPGPRTEELLLLGPLAGTLVLATNVLLLPARLLLKWRVDFDSAYYKAEPRRRPQLRLVDCINFTTACALLLACVRWLDANLFLIAAVAGGFALFSSLPFALLIVAPRQSEKAWLLSAIGFGIVAIVESLLAEFALGMEAGLLLPFHFGLLSTLFLNLLPLRLIFGLHRFSVAAAEP